MFNCYLVEYLQPMDYRKILSMQQKIRCLKENDYNFPEFLMVLQHTHVFTLGKNAKDENILIPGDAAKERGIDIVRIKRGGDVTYHGPGQLVGYFLLNLNKIGVTIKNFVWKMEETIIKTLQVFNIAAFRMREYPGVWVKDNNELGKIAAVGARASKMITTHGVALNVNTDMHFFDLIIPCGIKKYKPTSMENILGTKINIEKVYQSFEKAFEDIFNARLIQISEDEVLEMISEVA